MAHAKCGLLALSVFVAVCASSGLQLPLLCLTFLLTARASTHTCRFRSVTARRLSPASNKSPCSPSLDARPGHNCFCPSNHSSLSQFLLLMKSVWLQEQRQRCIPEGCWETPALRMFQPGVSVVAEPVQMAAVLTAATRLTTAAHLTTAVNVRTSGTGSACRRVQVRLSSCKCTIASTTSLDCLVQGIAAHVEEYMQRHTSALQVLNHACLLCLTVSCAVHALFRASFA